MCVTAKVSSVFELATTYVNINDVEDRVINGMLNEISYDFFFFSVPEALDLMP